MNFTHVALIDPMQVGQIRHKFGVDLQTWIALSVAPDQLFDAGVNIGAVKGVQARFCKVGHVVDRAVGLHLAVVSGQLPAASDQACDLIAWRQGDGLDRHDR